MSALDQALFAVLSLAGIACAIAVVTGRDIFRSTLFFGGFLLAVAGLYFTLSASLVGIMQVFVYVGGVVVMILFGIMLTERKGALSSSLDRRLTALGPVALLVMVLIAAISNTAFRIANVASETAPGELGRMFVGQYALPFEIVSVLLLAALVGAIILAKEREK